MAKKSPIHNSTYSKSILMNAASLSPDFVLCCVVCVRVCVSRLHLILIVAFISLILCLRLCAFSFVFSSVEMKCKTVCVCDFKKRFSCILWTLLAFHKDRIYMPASDISNLDQMQFELKSIVTAFICIFID